MKPLIVLVVTFLVFFCGFKVFMKEYSFALSARIAMSFMLVFTAIGHFVYTEGMALMLPEIIPYKTELVYLTGIIELAAAIGLQVPSLRLTTAWLLILFFILILPANIYAAIMQIDYQKASYDGSGVDYLWFRIPLQLLFIVWTYLSSIRPIAKGMLKLEA